MKRRVDFAKIRAVRKQKGLTQEQMARAIGYRSAAADKFRH
ncbi:MAG: helix-turn-helix domain-containing protein [Desulfurispora sp.]